MSLLMSSILFEVVMYLVDFCCLSKGVLRGEKVELAAIVKKQQARLQHLEAVMEETSKQVG